eukprot:scaffold663562_cov43-Prasinocladus_malaysianus.AAC.1
MPHLRQAAPVLRAKHRLRGVPVGEQHKAVVAVRPSRQPEDPPELSRQQVLPALNGAEGSPR